MATSISILKKAFDMLGNDRIRAHALKTAEFFGVRKNVVRIDTNGFCNIKCIFCATHHASSSDKSAMSLDNFKTVIDKFAPKTRVLYLACEFEPLATRNFHEYIKYACQSGVPIISFPTNGLKMNDKIVHAMVDGGMTEITYSFQGYESESYNRINFGSDFDNVIAGMESLAAYKREKNSRYPSVRINTILLASNLRNFGYLRELIEKYDVKTVQFRELLDTPGQNNPDAVELEKISTLDRDELDSLLIEIKIQVKELAEKGVDIILPASLAREDQIQAEFVSRKKNSCCIPHFSIWIDSRGEVKICPYNDNPAVGNVFKDSIVDIRKNMNQFRSLALSGECNQISCTINMDESEIKLGS